jgi:hypothetical protein
VENNLLNSGIGTIGGEPYYLGRSAAGSFYGEFSYNALSGLSYSGL